MYICTNYCVCGTHAGQKRMLDPLKQARERIVSDRVETGNPLSSQSVLTTAIFPSLEASFWVGLGKQGLCLCAMCYPGIYIYI